MDKLIDDKTLNIMKTLQNPSSFQFPTTAKVDDALNYGSKLKSIIKDIADSGVGPDELPLPSGPTDLRLSGSQQSLLNGLVEKTTGVSDACNLFEVSHYKNKLQGLHVIQYGTSIYNEVEGAIGSCTNMNDAMGPLSEIGSQIMDKISSGLKAIYEKLKSLDPSEQIEDFILDNLVKPIVSACQEITNLLDKAEDIVNKAKQAVVDYVSSSYLVELLNNPCTQSIIQMASSDSLLELVNGNG